MQRKIFTIFGCGVLTLFSLSFNVQAQSYTGDDWSGYDRDVNEGLFVKSAKVPQKRTMGVMRSERIRPGREMNARLREESNIALSPGGDISFPERRAGDHSLLVGGGSISLSPLTGNVSSSARGDMASLVGGNLSISMRAGDPSLLLGGGSISLSPLTGNVSSSARGDIASFAGGNLSISMRAGDIAMSPGGSISVLELDRDFPVFPGGSLSVSAGGGDLPAPSAVPLPGALCLLGSGFAGLVVAQRKKQ